LNPEIDNFQEEVPSAVTPVVRIDVVTIFPELFEPFVRTSIVGRAVAKGLASIQVHNLRDYACDRHKTVDDYPYGGGAGMVMRVEPFHRCLAAIRPFPDPGVRTVLFSARGELYDHDKAQELGACQRLILLCGHYKGVDERVAGLADDEVSVGDFVLSGGECAAMVVIDSIVRLIPGSVGDYQSVQDDSHFDRLLSAPEYTRPAEFDGVAVPPVLLTGDHARINEWRREQALEITRRRRPDLYRRYMESLQEQTKTWPQGIQERGPRSRPVTEES